MMDHPVVSHDEWIKARKELLKREDELNQARQKLMVERLALPWEKVEKDYVFQDVDGPVTLSDLFDGRSQLIVQHFMFHPDWDAGCPGCSIEADSAAPSVVHLANHDVTYVAVSRAPIEKIKAYQQRMGWPFRWVSSGDGDFPYDFNVSFRKEQIANGTGFYNYSSDPTDMEDLPGVSSFYKNEAGEIFHTLSEYAANADYLVTTNMLFDLAPLGRNEDGPNGDWLRRHDEYPIQPINHALTGAQPAAVSGGSGSCCH